MSERKEKYITGIPCPFCGYPLEIVKSVMGGWLLQHHAKDESCPLATDLDGSTAPVQMIYSNRKVLESVINTRPLESALSAENNALINQVIKAEARINQLEAALKEAESRMMDDHIYLGQYAKQPVYGNLAAQKAIKYLDLHHMLRQGE